MVVFGCFLHHFLTSNNENCANFSCESSRDGLKCQNPQIWAKMRPKIFQILVDFFVDFLALLRINIKMSCIRYFVRKMKVIWENSLIEQFFR